MYLSPLQLQIGKTKNVTETTGIYLPFKKVDSIFNLKFGGDSRPELLVVNSSKKVRFYAIQKFDEDMIELEKPVLKFLKQITVPEPLIYASASISFILLLLDNRRMMMLRRDDTFEVLRDDKKTKNQGICACYDNNRSHFIIGGEAGYDAVLRPANGKWELEQLGEKAYSVNSQIYQKHLGATNGQFYSNLELLQVLASGMNEDSADVLAVNQMRCGFFNSEKEQDVRVTGLQPKEDTVQILDIKCHPNMVAGRLQIMATLDENDVVYLSKIQMSYLSSLEPLQSYKFKPLTAPYGFRDPKLAVFPTKDQGLNITTEPTMSMAGITQGKGMRKAYLWLKQVSKEEILALEEQPIIN